VVTCESAPYLLCINLMSSASSLGVQLPFRFCVFIGEEAEWRMPVDRTMLAAL
jgi:hypothetical protein